MGKATRWLKGLLGGKKDSAGNEKRKDLEKSSGKERRREPVIAVRGHRRSGRRSSVHGEGLEVAAAVMIQSAFRGFLAKKALRALKALVKLQAMVRGFLVRKQTAAALQSMQALIRAQTLVLNRRSRVLPCRDQGRFHRDYHPRRSTERCDGSDNSPKNVEIDMNRPKPRTRRTNPCACDSADEFFTSPGVPQLPPRLLIPRSKNLHEQEWYLMADECRFSTAQNTPRLLDPSGPVTPSRSIRCVDSGLPHCPSYMANTQSFNAKLRSHSAPRQRPDSPSTRRKSNASEEIRRRSCSQALQEWQH